MLERWNVEKLQMTVAWWMPRWLVRWCAVRVFAHATMGRHSSTVATDLTAIEALRRWNKP